MITDFQNNKVYKYIIIYNKSGQLLCTVLNPPQSVSIAINCYGIGEWKGGKINVYGNNFHFKYAIARIGTYPRKIHFDSNDLIRVADFNNNMYISDRNNPGSVHIINNDGSEVL